MTRRDDEQRDLGRDRIKAGAVCDHCIYKRRACLWNARGEIACGRCQDWLARPEAVAEAEAWFKARKATVA